MSDLKSHREKVAEYGKLAN